ncbi:MAG: ferric reductase-like transmembrane domain-containing protein [Bacteroidetes bacterium]|nr:ferric reductase-like transmembrane domain-containing protein [Bacteroidota bacterium]
METIDISGALGLIAMVVLTLNIVLGIMLSTAYKQTEYWQKMPTKWKAYKIIDIHNYTAYVALVIVFLHFIIIPLDPSSKFSFIQLLFPLNAPHQPYFVLLGVISFIALLLVVITTQKIIKKKLGTTTWRNIHVISYATGLLFIIHGLVMDPLLKDRPIDFLDPEKLLVQFCALILIAAFVYRWNYKTKSK